MTRCDTCGHELHHDDRFCPSCGAPRPVPQLPRPPVPPPPAAEAADDPTTVLPAAPVSRSATRRRNTLLGGVALAVVIVIIAAAVMARGGGDDLPAGARRVRESDTTQIVNLPNGITVEIPPGSLTGSGHVAATEPGTTSPAGDALVAVGPWVDIAFTGAVQRGPVRITFPVTDPDALAPSRERLAPDAGPVAPTVFGAHLHDGTWELLDAQLSADRTTATVTTTSLSPLGVFSFAWEWIVDRLQEFASALTGGLYQAADPPDCDGDANREWTAAPTDQNALAWCAGAADTTHDPGSDEVRLVNRKRYALLLSATRGVDRIGDEPTSMSGNTELAHQLSELISSPRQAVLAPGDSVTFVVPPDAGRPRIESEYDGLSQALTSITLSADLLSTMLSSGRAKAVFRNSKSKEQMFKALDIAGCFRTAGINPAATAGQPVRSVTKLVQACYGPKFLREVFGNIVGTLLGGVVTTIASTLAYFWSSGEALVDQFRGDSDVTVAAGESTVTTTTSTTRPGRGSSKWPTEDNEGSPAYFAYLGASFILPEWSSCSRSYCIAGSGSTVHVHRTEGGLREVGEVPEASPDPVAALVALGLPRSEAELCLQPGPVT